MSRSEATIRIFLFLVLSLLTTSIKSQELYPNSEPASIIPKNALGLRLMNEAYVRSSTTQSWHGGMIMYGLSSKFMLNGMLTVSNHHESKLPDNYLERDDDHYHVNHPGPSTTYLFESVNLGFRYRFLNFDGDHRHFRSALYGNGVYTENPHDEAEVSLMGDNKAIGGGLISTLLLNKLAISLTGGIIKPFPYREVNSGISLNYANAYNYSVSFGYLVYPRRYKNYDQTNINFYAEFIGKSYNALKIIKNSHSIITDEKNHQEGNYVELRPAIQFIVRSNLRIDCSTAFPLIGRSYVREYPIYLLNIQYYFFPQAL